MRGLTAGGPARRPDGSERGATLVLIALLLVALIGMAALVVDIGNGWLVRRSLVPASDSAALAAAQRYVEGHTSQGECDAIVADYVGLNAPGAAASPCDLYAYDADRGRVTVTVTEDVDTWLAGVLGTESFPTSSTSSVAWGPPTGVSGLRPLGLCVAASPELEHVVANGVADGSIVIPYNKDQPDDCGDSDGNWGFVDLSGGIDSSNPVPDVRDWLLDGYDGEIVFGDDSVASCDNEPHCYDAFSGNLFSTNIFWQLDYLQDSGIWFWLPVFDFAENPGSPGKVHISSIVRVQLTDFRIFGNQSHRFLRLRVEPGLVTGTCCGDAGGASGNKVTAICAVDPDDPGSCNP